MKCHENRCTVSPFHCTTQHIWERLPLYTWPVKVIRHDRAIVHQLSTYCQREIQPSYQPLAHLSTFSAGTNNQNSPGSWSRPADAFRYQ